MRLRGRFSSLVIVRLICLMATNITERLSLTAQRNIRYRLKTPYRNGTTDVVFEPLARRDAAPADEPVPARHVAMSVKQCGDNFDQGP